MPFTRAGSVPRPSVTRYTDFAERLLADLRVLLFLFAGDFFFSFCVTEQKYTTSSAGIGLHLHAHAFPKSDVIFNLCSSKCGIGIKPCGVRVALAVYFHMVIARCALPRANRVSVTWTKIFCVHGIERKIVISL